MLNVQLILITMWIYEAGLVLGACPIAPVMMAVSAESSKS